MKFGVAVFLVCLMVAAVFGDGALAQGDAAIGYVMRMKGQVSVMRDGARAALRKGDQIYAKDILKTGLVGRLEVRFSDDSSVTLADRTSVSIDDYGLDVPNAHMNMRLMLGAVRAVSGKIAKTKPGGYTLSTPVATIGIRGTDVWAGTLDGRFNVVMLSGAGVVVENPRGRVELTQPGQSTQIDVPGVKPPSPDTPEEEVANIIGRMKREALAPGTPVPMASDRLSAVLKSVAF